MLRLRPADHVGALMAVPRNLRTMYIHAFQSFLWNAAASHRIATFGAGAAVAGDLVLPRTAAQQAALGRAAAAEGDGLEGLDGGEAEEEAEEEEAGGGGGGAGGGRARAAAALAAVHEVTAEEAAAGAFSIEDVVLPLPGVEVRYPGHGTAEVYRRVAAEQGVSLDASPHATREFSIRGLPGAYRHVVYRPSDLQYRLLRYDDPDAELATTDLMRLQGRVAALPTEGAHPGGCAPNTSSRLDSPSEPDAASLATPSLAAGQHLALALSFTLPSSCYATMLIRELTKQATTVDHHKGMTARHAAGQGEAAKPKEEPAAAAAAGAEEAAAAKPKEEPAAAAPAGAEEAAAVKPKEEAAE